MTRSKQPPAETQAETEAATSVGLPAGSHVATTAPPTVLSIDLAVVHHPISITDPIASKHPIGITRTLINIIHANSIETADQQPKCSLFMERASDSQITFFTQLQLPT